MKIIKMPESYLRIGEPDGPILGFMRDQNGMIPLVSGRCVLRQPVAETTTDQRVLVIGTGAKAFGIVVDRTDAIEHLAVIEDLGVSRHVTATTLASPVTRSLMVKTSNGKELISVLDMKEFGQLLQSNQAVA